MKKVFRPDFSHLMKENFIKVLEIMQSEGKQGNRNKQLHSQRGEYTHIILYYVILYFDQFLPF